MSKRKMIVFHPALPPYRIDFFNALHNSFDVSIYFSLNNLKEQKFDRKLIHQEIDFEFKLLNLGFEVNNRLVRFGIHHIIRKEKPEIIMCSEYSQITISVVLYKLLYNRKLKVYTISDDSIKNSIQRKGIRNWLRKGLSNSLDGIIFPSQTVSKWYSANVNGTIKTLELPIIHSNTIFRKKLLQTLDIAEQNVLKFQLAGKKIFLFVGRLVHLKNIDCLLKAFARSNSDNNQLILIGDGEEKQRLEDLSAKLNLTHKCKFIGRLEGLQLLSWYNISQCLVLASYREAYGAVVNEALLAGNQVLCSDYAGASVLIESRNGYTFDPYNVDQLAGLIDKVSVEINPVEIPLKLKPDRMPFTLEEKLETLFSQL